MRDSGGDVSTRVGDPDPARRLTWLAVPRERGGRYDTRGETAERNIPSEQKKKKSHGSDAAAAAAGLGTLKIH